MGNGSGVSRGDRNRNARLARSRVLVPVANAIVGLDLADRKQMVVLSDHDSKVLARQPFRSLTWTAAMGVELLDVQVVGRDLLAGRPASTKRASHKAGACQHCQMVRVRRA